MPVGTCVYCGAPIFSDEPHTTDSDGARRCKSHPEDLDALNSARAGLYHARGEARRLSRLLDDAGTAERAAEILVRIEYARAGPEGVD